MSGLLLAGCVSGSGAGTVLAKRDGRVFKHNKTDANCPSYMRSKDTDMSNTPLIKLVPTPEDIKSLTCPVCGDAMHTETLHNVTIDVCPKHGVWLDKKELLLVSEAVRYKQGRVLLRDLLRQRMQPPVDTSRTLSCPCCEEEMVLEMYCGVHLDWCRQHGIWLDTGELTAIMNNLRIDSRYRRGMTLRLWAGRY